MQKVCKCHYCSDLVDENEHHATKHCSLHKPGNICRKVSSRSWLYYKIEKFNQGDFSCERCKDNLAIKYPDRSMKELAVLFDVDHIDSTIKGTVEGEHPDNYMLLCKNCHALKTLDEDDFNPSKSKN